MKRDDVRVALRLAFRHAPDPLCDGCFARRHRLPGKAVSTVNRALKIEGYIARATGQCSGCGKTKLVNGIR